MDLPPALAMGTTQPLVVTAMTTPRNVWLVGLLLLVAAGCSPDVRAGDIPQEVRSAALGLEPPQSPAPPAPDAPLHAVTLFSELDAEIGARMAGVLTAMNADLGDAVARGQVIGQLDDIREAARLGAAAAALDLVRLEHTRAESLLAAEVISAADYEGTLSRLRGAEAAVQEAQVALELTRIRAPFDGVVTRRQGSVGRSVKEGDPLYRVTSIHELRALTRVPEDQARGLVPGTTVALRPNFEAAGGVVEAVIWRISAAVDPGSGTVEVLLRVPRPGLLKPGSTAFVRFNDAARP
jgi:RND family efflux transporter MFP subunit